MTEPSPPTSPRSKPPRRRRPAGDRQGMWNGSGDTSGYGGIVRSFERFPRADRPYGSYFDEIVDRLHGLLPALDLEHVVVAHDELTIFVPKADLLDVLTACRDDALLRFEVCVSVSGVHSPTWSARSSTRSTTCSPSPTTPAPAAVTCADADSHFRARCPSTR